MVLLAILQGEPPLKSAVAGGVSHEQVTEWMAEPSFMEALELCRSVGGAIHEDRLKEKLDEGKYNAINAQRVLLAMAHPLYDAKKKDADPDNTSWFKANLGKMPSKE